MAVTVRLDTGELRQLQKDLDPRVRLVIKKVAFEVKNRSEANVTRFNIIDTSALKNSHCVRMRGDDDSTLAVAQARRLNPMAKDARPPKPEDDLTAHVGPTVHYAWYQERGTTRGKGGIKGKHYLKQAVEFMRPYWDAAWKKLLP